MVNRRAFLSASVLTLLIAITLTSCIDTDKRLGSHFVPDDYDLKLEVSSFDLPVKMKMADSLQTIYSGAVVVGSNRDADLGLIEASSAFQIIPGVTENSFGDNPEPNYLKLGIAVDSKIVMESKYASIPQNIYIYKILTDLDSLKAYNNSLSAQDIDPVPINENTFYTGGDSISCRLSLDYARELLSATQLERDSLTHFFKRFKGLCISTDPQPGSLEGGRFNIITPNDITILMSYKHKESAKSIDKDSILYYYVSESGPNINLYKHSTKSMESDQITDNIYLEGLAGIKPFIDFAEVKSMLNNWATSRSIDIKKLVLAKAELSFPFEMPQDYQILSQFPQKIFLTKRETPAASSKKVYQPLTDIYMESADGGINRSNLTYNMDVTTYLQSVIKGEYISDTDLHTWVSPILTQSNYYTGAVTYFVENVTYYKAKLNGAAMARSPKLTITYAVLPE